MNRTRISVLTALLVVVLVAVAAVAWPPLSALGDSGGATKPLLTTTPTHKPDAVTVAFIGDAGMSSDTRAVLQMVKSENADVLVYSGDFDYQNDPPAWGDMLDEELGPHFPVVATIGNHDIYNWSGYHRVIKQRVERTDGLECTGDLGLQSTCTYRNVTVVQSAVGLCDYNDNADNYPSMCGENRTERTADPQQYVESQLANSTTTWNVCSWHLVNHAYQVGDKGTKVPASVYDTCRRGGGIIATGHDHAYARTYPMSNFSDRTVASRSPPYTIGDGTTFAFVNAAAGHSFYDRGEMADADWWASTHTNGSFGAFFCTLRTDGTGECYFKTLDGEVIDGPFGVRRAGASGATAGASPTTEAPSNASAMTPLAAPVDRERAGVLDSRVGSR